MLYKKLFTFCFILLTISSFAQSIDSKERQEVFASVKKRFAKTYHFKKMIEPTLSYLDQQWKAGKYDSMNKMEQFIPALAMDLQHVTHDKHLNFFYTPAEYVNKASTEPSMPYWLQNERLLNEGLTTLDILPGNVGYFRLRQFGDHTNNKEIVAAAFTFLKNTGALIIDVRGNGGGLFSNVVSSYLLPEDSILLNTIFWNDHTDSIYTYRKLDGPRYLNKPVYLLTDAGTFSSAEEFAYDLQNMKRVTIVGETTGGGANPGGDVPIYQFKDGADLSLFIPTAHVENSITKTNWEGRGIEPDVKTSSKEALKKAQVLALEYLAKQGQNNLVQKRYADIIASVSEGNSNTF